MNLSGQLSDWTMDNLIQIVQVTKKTGSLDIVGSKKGRVHFRDGELTGAELQGSQGVYAGTDPATIADIVFVLGCLETGTFAMGPHDGPDSDGHDPTVIAESVEELRNLETELSEAGILEAGSVSVISEIEEAVTLDSDDWRALSSLIPVCTIESLENRFGRGSAIRMLHVFHRLSVLQLDPVEVGALIDGDESDWLGQLADGVLGNGSGVDVDIAISQHSDEKDAQTDSVRTELLRGVSADASTTLTDGVLDEIRRLRSKAPQ